VSAPSCPAWGCTSGTFPLELSASITRPLTEEHWQQRFGERTWGVLSSLPGGATLRLLPGRRLLIRNTVEYRCRDLSPAQLQARRREHLNGLQKRFPGLNAEDLEYTWTGHLSGTRSGEPCFARVDEACTRRRLQRLGRPRHPVGPAAGRDGHGRNLAAADRCTGPGPPRLPAAPATVRHRCFLRMAWEVRRARLER
jgi:glycine/D-amino acid oxidase-like deaminating enzyme